MGLASGTRDFPLFASGTWRRDDGREFDTHRDTNAYSNHKPHAPLPNNQDQLQAALQLQYPSRSLNARPVNCIRWFGWHSGPAADD